jgi:hypothetical protein
MAKKAKAVRLKDFAGEPVGNLAVADLCSEPVGDLAVMQRLLFNQSSRAVFTGAGAIKPGEFGYCPSDADAQVLIERGDCMECTQP